MTTRRPLAALVGAGLVVGFLVAVALVRTLLSYLMYASYGQPDAVGLQLLSLFGDALTFGIGVYLVFWLLMPATGAWTLRRAIGAGALAAVGGAVLAGISDVVMALVFARQVSGSLYDLIPLNVDPVQLITSAVSTWLYLLPLTVLAAILVREWLRSRAAIDAPEEPAATV